MFLCWETCAVTFFVIENRGSSTFTTHTSSRLTLMAWFDEWRSFWMLKVLKSWRRFMTLLHLPFQWRQFRIWYSHGISILQYVPDISRQILRGHRNNTCFEWSQTWAVSTCHLMRLFVRVIVILQHIKTCWCPVCTIRTEWENQPCSLSLFGILTSCDLRWIRMHRNRDTNGKEPSWKPPQICWMVKSMKSHEQFPWKSMESHGIQ